jgi:NADH-quinone oxidoreductase subunit J
VAAAAGAVGLLVRTGMGPTALPAAPRNLGTIEGLGHELFTQAVVPFELSGALLLIAVVGAVAVARGKQPDPTMLPAAEKKKQDAHHPVTSKPGATALTHASDRARRELGAHEEAS